MIDPRKFLSFLLIAAAIFLFSPKTVFAQVVINEFVPDANPEWVEFYNASDSAEFIKSYWLDDDTDFTSDSGNSAKKPLTDLNTTSPSYPYIEISSFLNNPGDYVVLFNPSGVVVDQHQYASNPGDDVSIGRYPDGSGSFVTLASSTKGSANSGPQPTPSLTPEPTNTPTPTPKPPTPTPTPKSPTSTPTSPPSPTPTPKAVTVAGATVSGEILGEEESSPEAFYPWEATQEAEEAQEATPSKRRILPFVFLGLGLAFLAAAAYSCYTKLRWPEQGS